MVLFKRIKTRAHNYILGKKLKQIKGAHQAFSFSSASTVAVLFDGTKPEIMERVKKYHQYLRSLNKKVHMLCYIEKERPGEALSFDHISRRNLNWCFVPDQSKTKEFISQRFDLLLNLCTEECLPLEYISALSNAAYRVGRFIPEKTFCYDLMISMKDSKDIEYLIIQAEAYLKMVK